MTDRDRETVAWSVGLITRLGSRPVTVQLFHRKDGRGRRQCTSHRFNMHEVTTLIRTGILTLQSESPGVVVYVRAGPPEPKAAWLGGVY